MTDLALCDPHVLRQALVAAIAEYARRMSTIPREPSYRDYIRLWRFNIETGELVENRDDRRACC